MGEFSSDRRQLVRRFARARKRRDLADARIDSARTRKRATFLPDNVRITMAIVAAFKYKLRRYGRRQEVCLLRLHILLSVPVLSLSLAASRLSGRPLRFARGKFIQSEKHASDFSP